LTYWGDKDEGKETPFPVSPPGTANTNAFCNICIQVVRTGQSLLVTQLVDVNNIINDICPAMPVVGSLCRVVLKKGAAKILEGIEGHLGPQITCLKARICKAATAT